jgi:hypothetical protein
MQGNPLGQVTKNLPNSHVHLYTRWLEPGGGQLSKLSWPPPPRLEPTGKARVNCCLNPMKPLGLQQLIQR